MTNSFEPLFVFMWTLLSFVVLLERTTSAHYKFLFCFQRQFLPMRTGDKLVTNLFCNLRALFVTGPAGFVFILCVPSLLDTDLEGGGRGGL